MIVKRIILLRHGESEANVDSTVYSRVPDWRIELTQCGVEQAKNAGERIAGIIGNDSFGVFASPYRRTLQTKDAMLAGIGREPIFDYQDPCLREQEYGNMPPSDVNTANCEFRKKFGFFFYRFPDGESCADVYDRMALFLDTLYRRFENPNCPGNIIIVSHGAAIKCFLARWYRWSVEYFDSLKRLPNCHISLMTRDESTSQGQTTKFVLSEPFESNSYFYKGL
jgi:broad specificity phosphatase PhoE